MDKPAWFSQLSWSHPRPVTDFLLDAGAGGTGGSNQTSMQNRGQIPCGSGLYAYTGGGTPFLSVDGRNLLYVGKADGACQTLRTRLSVYFRRFARANFVQVSKHAGLDMLDRHHRGMYRAKPGPLYVCWVGCAISAQLEGTFIDMYDPPYNFKRESDQFPDDAMIDPQYL